MTKQDMDDLWKLLGKFRMNDPHLEDTALKEAWRLVLKPYKPSDVGKAVAAYFREQKFWPDPTDIAKLCPRQVDSGVSVAATDSGAWLQEWYEKRVCELQEAGLPTWWAAKESGMTFAEYNELLEAHGL